VIAYLLAVFLLGFLAGGAFGFHNAERDRQRREQRAWRRFKEWSE
jgi:hypothetical protein